MRTHAWRGVLLAIIVSVGCAVAATPAQALIHSWNCTRSAYNHCTDPDASYHTWIETDSGTTDGSVVNLCTKAETQAGNIRSTTASPPTDEWCDFNTTIVGRCLTSTTPTSRSYSYWGGAGSQVSMHDSSETPSNSGC